MSLPEFQASFSFSRSHADRFRVLNLDRSLLSSDEDESEHTTSAMPPLTGSGETSDMADAEDYSLDNLDVQSEPAGIIIPRTLSKTNKTPTTHVQAPARKPLAKPLLILAFIGCGTCWGASFLFINKCLPTLDPCTVALMRCTLAFGLLFTIQLALMYLPCIGSAESRQKQRSEFLISYSSPRTLFQMATLGFVFSSTASTLIAVSETHVSGGVTGIILMSEPLIAPFFAKAVLPKDLVTEPITKWTVIGLVLGLGGTAVSSLPTIAGSDSKEIIFLFACLGASLLFVVGTIVSQSFGSRRPVLHRIIGQMFFGMIFLLPITFLLRTESSVFSDWGTDVTPLGRADVSIWAWLICLSWGPTVAAWGLFYVLMQELGSLSTAVNFLIPPVSMMLGALFNGEWGHLSTMDKLLEVGGMIIVLLGVGFVLYNTVQYEKQIAAEEAEQKKRVNDRE